VVPEWNSARGRNQSTVRRDCLRKLHDDRYDQRLQQHTFCCDCSDRKSDSTNTDDHTQRADNFLRRWKRDDDIEQRYGESVVSEWQSDWRRN